MDYERLLSVALDEPVNFSGGLDWPREAGVNVIDLRSAECLQLPGAFIRAHPALWAEDIGEA